MKALIQPSTLAYEAIDFHNISERDYLPALKETIEDARVRIGEVVNDQETPTFENTIKPFIDHDARIEHVEQIFHAINYAHGTDEMQRIAKDFSPLISQFQNDVNLNDKLFEKIKYVYDKEMATLESAEDKTVLEKVYSSFTRNGALLSEQDKQSLRDIDSQIAKLTPLFSENVLKSANASYVHLTNEDDLAGFPDALKHKVKAAAKTRDLDGWVLDMQIPVVQEVQIYAEKEHVRKSLWETYSSKATKEPYDNSEVIKSIIKLKHKRAKLLGYETFAQYVLEDRMAKTPETVWDFLHTLGEASLRSAKKELQDLQDFKESLGLEGDVKLWDVTYLSHKLKEKTFTLNEDKLREYFPLPNSVKGVFMHAEKLYGLKFERLLDVPVYEETVEAYRVSDTEGHFKGLLYLDLYNRNTKKSGAWCGRFRKQWKSTRVNIRPHVYVVCNFSRPTGEEPTLLRFREVKTLFHEFGHALHNLLSECTYRNLSCTQVLRDFVELPSQIFENWLYEAASLSMFARHYETGELIPNEYVEKLKDSMTFQAGMQSLRQVNFATLDMSWHDTDPSRIGSVSEFEFTATKKTTLIPHSDPNCVFSNSFSHIFSSNYSAGYYGYKWAEVLDADAFSVFLEKGIFNQEVADSFKENILSKGGSEDPMELYIRFRGSKPDVSSLLEKYGIG